MSASDQRTAEQKKSAGIFISYRRSDSPDATGRIYDRLVSEFGKGRVFKDVDSIPLGRDFRSHLDDIVAGCAAVLAIIGPHWIDTRNSAGQRRLEDAEDFVRIELEAALARDIPVVPVLVAHAPMPGVAELPSTLASMAFRQSIEVRPDPDFHNDATRLVTALRQILDPNALVNEGQSGRQAVSGATPAVPQKDRRLVWTGALAATAIVVAAALAVPALKHLQEVPTPESRIAIPLSVKEDAGEFVLSPDGRQIVYRDSGDSERRLWLRTLATTMAEPLPGTGGAYNPFWAPDGRSVGFFAAGFLKRLDLGDGQPQNLAPVKSTNLAGGVWSANGDILFTPGPGLPIARIPSTGGPVTKVGKPAGVLDGRVPLVALPDGLHFLYVDTNSQSGGIYLGTLNDSPPVRLTVDVSGIGWLPSGWMVWLRRDNRSSALTGPLLAQRLDLRSARLIGEPVSMAGDVGAFSVAATGLVAYETAHVNGMQQLIWVDRSGKEIGTVGDADSTLSAPRVAPDGRRVVVSKVAQSNRDLWLLDGNRASRMTFNAAADNWPIWSPDGLRITFTSNRSGTSDKSGSFVLYQKLANGAGEEEPIQTPDKGAYPAGWSADGQYLLYFAVDAEGVVNSWVLPQSGDHKPFKFRTSPFTDVWGQFSPDGQWVAYISNESGHNEVFVRPFSPSREAESKSESNSASGQAMASTAGGISPMWSANGKEIYFLNPAGEMMAAPIKIVGSAIVPGMPVKLFDSRVAGGGEDHGRQYDVAPDGRFLINRVRDTGATSTITLLQNWNPKLKK